MPPQTPSQTAGPYFRIGLYSDNEVFPRIFTGEMATPAVAGNRIRVEGTIYDGAGEPIPDAMLEIWQADNDGRFRTPEGKWNDGFTGFGRIGTDDAGHFVIDTIMPGRVAGPQGTMQAPHLSLIIYMRGMLLHAFTRMYFDEHAALHAADPVLALVPKDRLPTLVACKRPGNSPSAVYRFDIHMQGDDETVFFDV